MQNSAWQELLQLPRIAPLHAIALKAGSADPAHDFSHCLRVLRNAWEISLTEGGQCECLAAAAFLHDLSNLPKDHPDSRWSSEKSAEAAVGILHSHNFSTAEIEVIQDAIRCHSFSRGLQPQTLEGKIFQDADRLDALGWIGLARTFSVGGALGRPLYSSDDPFGESGRAANDRQNTLDHFFVKLLGLEAKMQTPTGRRLARERTQVIEGFISGLKREIE